MNTNKFFIAGFLLTFCFQLSAQISIGVKASKLRFGYTPKGELLEEALFLEGKNYAFIGLYHIDRHFSFGLEPAFSVKEHDYATRPPANDVGGFNDMTIHQMELPAYLRFHFPILKDYVGIFTKTGVRPSHIFWNLTKDEGISNAPITVPSLKTRKINYDYLLGMGFQFCYKVHSIIVEASYFREIKDRDNLSTVKKEFQLGLGYLAKL